MTTRRSSFSLRTFATLAVAGLTFSFFAAAPTQAADTSAITISGNTSTGENIPGWNFGRDASNQTAFWFTQDSSSTGSGSLYVAPIRNVTSSDKFTGELFFASPEYKGVPIADLKNFSFDYKWVAEAPYSWTGKAAQIYMNIYVNYSASPWDYYYDCRFDVVATVGSLSTFSKLTFDPNVAATAVRTRAGSAACPVSKKAADLSGGVIRAIAINVGDTTISDRGLGAYIDNVVMTRTADADTYDFEESPLTIGGVDTTVYGGVNTLAVAGGNSDAEPTFSVGESTACAVVANTLTITSGTGTCNVTATKKTLGNWFEQTTTRSISVSRVATSTTLTTSENPTAPGSKTFSVTVIPSEATGTVQIADVACTLQVGTCDLSVPVREGSSTITANYLGDQNYAPSAGSLALVADGSGPQISALTVSADTAAPGARVTLSAEAADSLTTVASARYKIGEAGTWSRMLPADGVFDSATEAIRANVTVPDLDGQTVTLYVQASDVLGNNSAESTISIMVEKPHPVITYTGPLSAIAGTTTTLTAAITTQAGKAMANETLILTVDGISNSATTNRNGVATWLVTAPADSFAYTITHPQDTTYGENSISGAVTLVQPSTLLYTGPTSAAKGTTLSVSAQLSGPAAGATVTFALGKLSVTAQTSETGYATASFKAPTAKGAVTLMITYAGSDTYAPVTTSVKINVI